MKKNDKITNITTIFAVTVLLIVTMNATYAYFNSKLTIGNGIEVNTNTANTPTFTSYAPDELSLSVTAANLANASTTASATDNGSIITTLSSSKEGEVVYCTYDISLVWDTTNQYVNPTTTLTGDYKYEISLMGSQTIANDTTGHIYGVTSLTETNLTSFTWEGDVGSVGRSAKIISGAEIYSKSLTATTATWNFTLKFYTIPTNQSALLGQSYGAHLQVHNVVC